MCLRALTRKVALENNVKAQAMSSSQYVWIAVENIKKYLDTVNKQLSLKNAPISFIYYPELNMSLDLLSKEASHV